MRYDQMQVLKVVPYIGHSIYNSHNSVTAGSVLPHPIAYIYMYINL